MHTVPSFAYGSFSNSFICTLIFSILSWTIIWNTFLISHSGLGPTTMKLHAHTRTHNRSSVHTQFFILSYIALSLAHNFFNSFWSHNDHRHNFKYLYPTSIVYHRRNFTQFIWLLWSKVDGFHSVFSFEVHECFQNKEDRF